MTLKYKIMEEGICDESEFQHLLCKIAYQKIAFLSCQQNINSNRLIISIWVYDNYL